MNTEELKKREEELKEKELELEERELELEEKELQKKELELEEKEKELKQKTTKAKEKEPTITPSSSTKKSDEISTWSIVICCCVGILIIAIVGAFIGHDSNTTDENLTNNTTTTEPPVEEVSQDNKEVIQATTNDKFTYYGKNNKYLGIFTFTITIDGETYAILDPIVDFEDNNFTTFKAVLNYNFDSEFGRHDELAIRNILGGKVGSITLPSAYDKGPIFNFAVDKDFNFTYTNESIGDLKYKEMDEVWF